MTKSLVLCQGAQVDGRLKSYDRTDQLWLHGSKKNIELKIETLERKVVENLAPACMDLLDIAAFCYVSDALTSRGYVDETGERWYRELDIVIPVRELDRWAAVQDELSEALTFLTGDRSVCLRFCEGSAHESAQYYLKFPHDAPGFGGAESCVLFSGGLDSLAGAVRELSGARTPLLVSHRSHPARVGAQLDLARALGSRWNRHIEPLNVWCRPIGIDRADVNQRMRAFLYLSLGIVVTVQLGMPSFKFCENGINTFHVPLSEQRVGSKSTRTTHPRVIRSLETIASKVFQRSISIENPLMFHTKGEVLSVLVDGNCRDLIPVSQSCTRTTGMSREKPHCGTCYQCLMRRFAIIDRGLEEIEPPSVYKKDVFIHGLSDGEEKANALDWVRMHQRIRNLSSTSFFGEYPSLLDALSSVPGSTDEVGENVYQLYQRSAESVERVLEAQFSKNAGAHIRGGVHAESLLGMLGRFEHLVEPTSKYATMLATILDRGLRKAFSRGQPKMENEVQRICDASLAAAGERLNRESPTFSYSVVHAKPDFSRKDNRLYVETKLVKENTRLDRIVTEMNNDILQYRSQGAAVLFVVYQTSSLIPDIEKFAEPFIAHAQVFVKVVP